MNDEDLNYKYAVINFKKAKASGNKKFSKLDNWVFKESNIFENETRINKISYPNFKRGEIIKVDFGINIGTELSHTHYAIVINKDDSNSNDNITVIPISSKAGYRRVFLGKILKKAMPNTTRYNLNCYAMVTQLKTISKKRIFKDKMRYICNSNILDKIDKEIVEIFTK